MKIRKKIILSLFLLLIYLIIDRFWRYLGYIDGYTEINKWLKYAIRYTVQIGLCLLFTFIILQLIRERRNIFETLGLNKNIGFGLSYSFIFIFTLPMLLGYLIIAPINKEATLLDILF
jgi:hypothetical protein